MLFLTNECIFNIKISLKTKLIKSLLNDRNIYLITVAQTIFEIAILLYGFFLYRLNQIEALSESVFFDNFGRHQCFCVAYNDESNIGLCNISLHQKLVKMEI